MIPALILFALGLADWLTTRAIIAHGGYERNPVARAGIARLGFTPFFVGKALAMGALGYATTLHTAGVYLAGVVVLIYAAVLVNNVVVLRRLP